MVVQEINPLKIVLNAEEYQNIVSYNVENINNCRNYFLGGLIPQYSCGTLYLTIPSTILHSGQNEITLTLIDVNANTKKITLTCNYRQGC